jgi:hypothetical protein
MDLNRDDSSRTSDSGAGCPPSAINCLPVQNPAARLIRSTKGPVSLRGNCCMIYTI